MTRKALLVKQRKPQKYSTREYNRCQRCGRARAYYRKFGLCRICLRQLAHEGKVPGVKKASW
ncbi:type Z 30S ribosomal protein S14 [Rubrobacter calidifluminis]|uniref:type Z 30S ribosomal protein S14 n=1 Tax=Rubrobacter calidifluminis TaxID=1392640 RepID=UPI002363182A|nr:type Z 30S ribosomal protein S14 [Rubrobacter calidifluminis]